MPRPKTVEIKKGELTGKCTVESLKAWERNGWTRVDDGDSEPAVEDSSAPVEYTPDFLFGDDPKE